MAAGEDPAMLGDDAALGRDHDPFGVGTYAHRAVGEGGRHAVAVALEGDQAGRGDALEVLDAAIERRRHLHQVRPLLGPDLGDRALALLGMADRVPLGLAAPLEPGVERGEVGELGHLVPDARPGVLHGLLDLALLPAGGRVAEVRLEQEVPGHGPEARVHGARLAAADRIDRRLHVVVDAALRHAAEDGEGVVVGVEQHLVGLLRVGAQHEGAAVAELELRHGELLALAADHRPVLAPVELERFARGEHQRHEGAAARARLLIASPLPRPRERGHAVVGAAVAERHEIVEQLPPVAPLLTPARRLPLEPRGEHVAVRVELARALALGIRRLQRAVGQVLANRVPGKLGAPGNLANRYSFAEMPAPNHTQ